MTLADTLTDAISRANQIVEPFFQTVEWLQRTGDRDVRGRQSMSSTELQVVIEKMPALSRGSFETERSDAIMLTLLEPRAIGDDDLFRWGGHVYKISSIDGVVQDNATGVRFASKITVIR